MTNENQYVWRGTYGDTEPVRVHMTNALDFRGALLEDHFQSEEAAWGNILACMEADVTLAVGEHKRAIEELDNARRAVNYRRARYGESCRAFDVWKARHPLGAKAVAV